MRCFKLEIYVPATHADAVRRAIGEAGAGRLGKYDCCIWECAGTGHFRPLPGSVPFTGEIGEIASVPEVKLETICLEERLEAVLAALRAAHPYEVPAFQFFPVFLEKE